MFLSVFHLLNKHHALPVFGKLSLMPWVVKYLDKACKDTAQYAGNKTKRGVCVVFGNGRTSQMVEFPILRHIVRATVCMLSIIELNLGSKPILDYVWNVNNYHSSNTTLHYKQAMTHHRAPSSLTPEPHTQTRTHQLHPLRHISTTADTSIGFEVKRWNRWRVSETKKATREME